MEISPLTCTAEQLFTLLSTARTPALRLCLSNRAMGPQHIVQLLRNKNVTNDIVESICENQDWITQQSVVNAIVNCPKTPHTLGLRMMQLLFWNNLLKTAGNLRISPRLRRAAENHLRDKLSELTLGEKMTAARTGPRVIISFLRGDREMRVIEALLRNPHMIEDDIIHIINDELTAPEILRSIGSDYKWSHAYPIRLALVRNDRTPLPVALSLLSKLRRQDLDGLVKAPQAPELVRRAAKRIVEGDY